MILPGGAPKRYPNKNEHLKQRIGGSFSDGFPRELSAGCLIDYSP